MDWNFVREITPTILEGLSITLSLFLWSVLFSTIGGLILALMRLSGLAPLRWFSAFFGWLFRGIPLLLIMFYVFFALPEFGETWTLPPFRAAVVALSMWAAAYQSEAIRSGIISVDVGQFEAAEALGMSRFHYMRRIVLPQSVRIIVPPFTGNAINLMKQTSLATVITVPEMTLLAQRIISNEFKAVEPLFALAIIFLALTSVLVLAQIGLEHAFRLKT
ncbi:MAG: amino acid ABC transporter permease [Acidimicrobiia bacterium]|nr:amino acid ABC transporter permease [Acidimicrobiia bacterium]